MHKRTVLQCLVLLLALGLIAGIYVTPSLAQGGDESITITTYYPSPYGVYNELQTNRFAVGDTNESDGTLDAGDQPPQNGQIYTARSVIFKPQTNLTAIQGLPDPKIGELVYASGDDKWYYNNTGTSSGWVAQGGGSGIKSIQHGLQTAAIKASDTTELNYGITKVDRTKTEVKVWIATLCGIINVSWAPYLTPDATDPTFSTNLKLYVANNSGAHNVQVTYEIIEYQ